MSYLNAPRLHMSGQFFTDPSTVNNDPSHYEVDCTKPSPWQEPNGEHRFILKECYITSALDNNGIVNSDEIIGAAVDSNLNGYPARIVDLDVYQQGVSTVFGMSVTLTLPDNTAITGVMDRAVLNSCWFNAVLPTRGWDEDYGQDSFGGDMNACGVFHTIITFDAKNWPENTSSAVLNLLRGATLQQDGKIIVSFKFVVDGYENVPQNANYRHGRFIGTIGTFAATEPKYCPSGRWLTARDLNDKKDPWYYPSFYSAPFIVDKTRKVLVIDLGNSICRASAGGPPVDLGTITAVLCGATGYEETLGQVPYSEFAYNNNAMVLEVPLTDKQVTEFDTCTLKLVMSRTDLGNQVIFKENEGALNYAAETRVIRVQGTPGAKFSSRVYVTQCGAPLANKQLYLFIENVHGYTPGATVPPTKPGNTPQGDGALVGIISATDENGFATIEWTITKDPGRRTPQLDGQLYYGIIYDDPAMKPVVEAGKDPYWKPFVQEQSVSVLVWSESPVNTNPTWEEIQTMMVPYMKLYPSMRKQLDLTDQHSFTIYALNPPFGAFNNPDHLVGPLGISKGAIAYYMSLGIDHPHYMPITRDLSPNRAMTLMYYIYNLQQQSIVPGPGDQQNTNS